MTSVQEAVYGKACSPVERRLIGAGLNPKAHFDMGKNQRFVMSGGWGDRWIFGPVHFKTKHLREGNDQAN